MDTEKLLRRALVMLQQGKTGQARAMCRKLIEHKERRFDSHHLYGVVLLQSGMADQAVEQIRTALTYKAPPAQRAQALSNLGLALQADQQYQPALQAFDQALELNPGDQAFWINRANLHEIDQNWPAMAHDMRAALQRDLRAEEAWTGLAIAQRQQGRLKDALHTINQISGRQLEWLQEWALLQVLNGKTGQLSEKLNEELATDTWLAVADYLVEQGAGIQAVELYNEIIRRQPGHATATHMLAALQGGHSERAPHHYVRELYERNAARFEHHLTQNLNYAAPAKLASWLADSIPEPDQALDLGCGSGLMGLALKQHWPNLTLTGVDLSPAMLHEAEQKTGCYSSLFEADAQTYLSQQADNSQPLICATDMLIYLGDLAPLLNEIKRTLCAGGYYAFTVEQGDKGVELTPSGRFRHSRAYLQQALKTAGLSLQRIEAFPLRLEKDHQLSGLMVIARH